nr:MAG TPA: hypothetical protein [Caudoviricetes sp.]
MTFCLLSKSNFINLLFQGLTEVNNLNSPPL